MIVDVIDLNFKFLNFRKQYDNARNYRARRLYEGEYVNIKSVTQNGDDKYLVKASVDGNYDLYDVELNIGNRVVTEATCTCADYDNGFICKHILATSMEVIDPHNATTEDGKRRLMQKRMEEERKRQEEIKRQQEIERKRMIYRRKYSNCLEAIEQFKQLNNFDINEISLQDLYEYVNQKNMRIVKIYLQILN